VAAASGDNVPRDAGIEEGGFVAAAQVVKPKAEEAEFGRPTAEFFCRGARVPEANEREFPGQRRNTLQSSARVRFEFQRNPKSPQGNTLPSRQHDTQHSEFVSCVGACSMGQDRPLHAVTRGATRDKHGRPHASSCRCHVDDELCERSASHSAGDLAAQSLS
jgi:hypothetical protein